MFFSYVFLFFIFIFEIPFVGSGEQRPNPKPAGSQTSLEEWICLVAVCIGFIYVFIIFFSLFFFLLQLGVDCGLFRERNCQAVHAQTHNIRLPVDY